MLLVDRISRIFAHLRHPVSLPQDLSKALGIPLSNRISFDDLISCLRGSCCSLKRGMPRQEVERRFSTACRVEIFRHHALFAYFFKGRWLEVSAKYDLKGRLSHLYVLHELIPEERGIEVHLKTA